MFTASNLLDEALGITNSINLTAVKSSLFEGAYQTTLTPLPKNIYIFTAIKLTKYLTKLMGSPQNYNTLGRFQRHMEI